MRTIDLMIRVVLRNKLWAIIVSRNCPYVRTKKEKKTKKKKKKKKKKNKKEKKKKKKKKHHAQGSDESAAVFSEVQILSPNGGISLRKDGRD